MYLPNVLGWIRSRSVEVLNHNIVDVDASVRYPSIVTVTLSRQRE